MGESEGGVEGVGVKGWQPEATRTICAGFVCLGPCFCLLWDLDGFI